MEKLMQKRRAAEIGKRVDGVLFFVGIKARWSKADITPAYRERLKLIFYVRNKSDAKRRAQTEALQRVRFGKEEQENE